MNSGRIFTSFLLLTFLVSGQSMAQQFGPWRIGMSQREVENVSAFGPYETREISGTTALKSQPAVSIRDEKFPVRMQMGGGAVARFSVSLGTFETAEETEIMVQRAFEFLYDHYKIPIPEEVRLLPISTKVVERGIFNFSMPEYPNQSVTVAHLSSVFSISITIRPEGMVPTPEHVFKKRSTSEENTTVATVPPSGEPGSTEPPAEDEDPEKLKEIHVEKPGGDTVFKRSLSSVHALLVRQIFGGGNAAQAMLLTATAVTDRTDGLVGFGFNQPVGPEMRRSFGEVVRAIQIRHGTLPANQEVQFGFADKWSSKDGPSASVAIALLLESLFEGFEISKSVAVTGDLNANSMVQPVGGVADKIRGAMERDCVIIGIPAANEMDLNDLVVEENLRLFLDARIFVLSTLDEAVDMANPEALESGKLEALREFEAIQSELKVGGASALFDPGMIKRLNAVVSSLPNLYSAKILLAAAERRVPTTFSLVGTLVRIDESMSPFQTAMERLEAGEPIKNLQFGRDNPLTEARNRLRKLREKSEPRLIRVIESQGMFIDRLQRLINSNAGSRTVFENYLDELRIAEDRASDEWDRIMKDQTIQDDLMKRGISL